MSRSGMSPPAPIGCERLPVCAEPARRGALRSAGHLNGIDFVDVGDDGITLCVHLFGPIPPGIGPEHVRIAGGDRITGLRAIRVDIEDDPDMHEDACLRIVLNREGDHSPYCLCLVEADSSWADRSDWRPYPGFDPRHACVELRFRLGCGRAGDCANTAPCTEAPVPAPEIDYLAKDYESFRQLFLDRMAQTLPDWRERHVPDVGIALIEVLAYTADHLSYYQDAVATEAYLGTARKRISVRRHARLVDYRMHEGCNARALVTLHADDDVNLSLQDVMFIVPPPGERDVEPGVLEPQALEAARAAGALIFEPMVLDGHSTLEVIAAHSEIQFHTWGDGLCCLPRGSTRATLRDPGVAPMPEPETPGEVQCDDSSDSPAKQKKATAMARALKLKPGDLLVFEEIMSARTGAPADADPSRRHAVRLTSVRPAVDVLDGSLVLEIEWDAADALPFDLCLSARLPAPSCTWLPGISVARGNVVLVDHGEHVDHLRCDCSLLCDPDADLSEYPGAAAQRDALKRSAHAALTAAAKKSAPKSPAAAADAPTPCEACSALHEDCWWVPGALEYGCCHCDDAVHDARRRATSREHVLPVAPLTWAETVPAAASAYALFTRDPRRALPQVAVYGGPLSEVLMPASPAARWRWQARPDLLGSSPDERHFVVEIDDEGLAHLRFGNGVLGRQPLAGDFFRAAPRVGNGPAGNVGRDSLVWLAFKANPISGIGLRPRNPLPATGGTAPESIPEVKLFAPGAFRAQPLRAVIAADYTHFAGRVPGVQSAACTMEWTGSWYEANVAVDAAGRGDLPDALDAYIEGELERYRRIGHDLAVEPARYVPVIIELRVCVKPEFLIADIESELRDRFGSSLRRDGIPGFFHPDRLRLGEPLYASALIAEAQRVTGVAHVELLTLARQESYTAGDVPEDGVLPMALREVAQVAGNPDHPDRGSITFVMGGGR